MKIVDKMKAKVVEPQQRTAILALAAFVLACISFVLISGMIANASN